MILGTHITQFLNPQRISDVLVSGRAANIPVSRDAFAARTE